MTIGFLTAVLAGMGLGGSMIANAAPPEVSLKDCAREGGQPMGPGGAMVCFGGKYNGYRIVIR
ncbi:hypothetical protein [Nocardia panacis]|uniref:hypothetical protein n=1 Tax=Nocardia panacis TaxID=2340916 RepID=UPI0011C422DF|nr:hypothetical protein [Nocardia panacis]